MEFIINNLPILICAVVGIALLIFEMFMPGFGIPGISGIALLIVSVVFTWMEHGMLAGLGAALVVIVAGGLAVYLSLRSASRGRLSRSPLILKGAQTRDEGFVAQDELTGFVGRTGRHLSGPGHPRISTQGGGRQPIDPRRRRPLCRPGRGRRSSKCPAIRPEQVDDGASTPCTRP